MLFHELLFNELLFHKLMFHDFLEQVAALAEEGIHESYLLFRDTSPSPLNLPDFSLILVDHNVLGEGDKALESQVVEILDHHARETKLQKNVTIEPTGSCASLVLRTILKENPGFKDICSTPHGAYNQLEDCQDIDQSNGIQRNL